MSRLSITKQFKFEAAHVLPNHEGACNRLHGHSYLVEVSIEGYPKETGAEAGMVMDFGNLKQIVNREVIDKMDHQFLNEIPGLENPTAENMCVWIWDKLSKWVPGIANIRVWETATAYAEYKGERV